MIKRWVLTNDEPVPRAFQEELNVSPLIAEILWRRNIKNISQASNFLRPRAEDLKNPGRIAGIHKAKDRLLRAAQGGEKILIYGDYDADGLTSSAMLYRLLSELGARVSVFIPDRIKQGYGLDMEALKHHTKKGVKLVVAVDNGITNVDEIDYLNSNKITTIVIDHHKAKTKLPAAFCIISGELEDGSGEDTDYAACGLVFELAWVMLGSFEKAAEFIELAALGTVADMARLEGDNRIMVRLGIDSMSEPRNLGLGALIRSSGLGRRGVSSEAIAFQLAPRLNAAGRIASPENALNLLITNEPVEAANLGRLLDEGNKQRRRIENAAYAEAMGLISGDPLLANRRIMVIESEHWHEGIVGIIANRLVEAFGRPAIVIALKDGIGKGSGRSTAGISLFEALNSNPALFRRFGGHDFACGLEIEKDKIGALRTSLERWSETQTSFRETERTLKYDAEISLDAVSVDLVRELSLLEPCGMGNPAPVFITRNLRVKNSGRSRGGFGSAFWVEDEDNGRVYEAITFRKKLNFTTGDRLDLAYRLKLNTWEGLDSINLFIEDARTAAETAPLKILS